MRQVPLLLPEGQTRVARLERSASEADVAPGEDGNRVTLSHLPVLLAGPILRYAADDEVVVWVATSVPVTVVGRVMDEHVDSNGRPSGSPAELRTGRTRPVQLATNLFVTHVSIPGPFPKRRILSYDLAFVAPPGHRFAGGRGLVKKETLTYGELTLPSFILDQTDRRGSDPVRRTVFMHGSCRKLCGPGPDMASKLDEKLNDTHRDVYDRPRYLLLTGDQIYGDDTPPDLLPAVLRTSRKLLGFYDRLPNTSATLASRRRRQELVARDAGFTSGAAEQHLMGFGEYAATYLFAWSPAVWDCAAVRSIIGSSARNRNYQDSVYMRRAMANVPTYMMWDDHEVTDDWPLDNAMVRDVGTSPYGDWIIANGTACAFFFQLLGNYARRGRGRYRALAGLLTDYSTKGVAWERARDAYLANPDDEALHQTMDAAYGEFCTAREQYVTAGRTIRGLHAVTPTVPEVMLLDTRTQRDLSEDDPPGLLDAAARSWVRRQFGSMPGPGYEPLLIVSPAPVVGNPTFEGGQEVLGPLPLFPRRYALDCEAWSLNRANLRAFLETLRRFMRKLVFISGDVHFAYTALARYGDLVDSNAISFVQMTGSSMRNHPVDLGQPVTSATSPIFPQLDPGMSYRFVTDSSLNASLVVDNNVSLAVVDWVDASAVRVTHTIITAGAERVHEVHF